LEGLCQGLTEATELFYQERYFHPEMERADKAFQTGIIALGPLFKPDYYKGTVAIGSLSIHESGIRLIEVMLRGAGLKVINLGTEMTTEGVIAEAVKARAHVIALGVYFRRYAKRAEHVTRRLRKRGLKIKTIAGGMGIAPQMAEDLNVDAYAADGQEAKRKVLALLGY
jgi:5-methyltetrahydrofolate--homocysteine methyltransferase